MNSYRCTADVIYRAAAAADDELDDDDDEDDGDWVTSSLQQQPSLRPALTGSRRLDVRFMSKTGS